MAYFQKQLDTYIKNLHLMSVQYLHLMYVQYLHLMYVEHLSDISKKYEIFKIFQKLEKN